MTTTLPNLIELAKKGDATSIAVLMNRQLQPKGITAKATLKNDCLQVVFEAAQVPDQEVLIAFTEKGIKGLKIASVQRLKVYGRQIDEDFPEWQQEILLEQLSLPSALPETAVVERVDEQLPQSTPPSQLELAKSGDVGSIAEVLSYFFKEQNIKAAASLKNGCLCIVLQSETTPDQESSVACIRKFLDQLESPSWTKVKIDGWRKGATFRAWQQEISLNASTLEAFSLFGAITKTVQDTGASLLSVTSQAGQAIGAAGNAALQATNGAGYMLDVVNQSPQLETLTKALKVDWLLKIIDQVDIIKAETQVKQLQKKYPHEQPGEIAHRLIVEKALYVGGTGFASSLVPGFAAPMFAVDLVATTAIQAELGYQIACAYGLNPNEPARKVKLRHCLGRHSVAERLLRQDWV